MDFLLGSSEPPFHSIFLSHLTIVQLAHSMTGRRFKRRAVRIPKNPAWPVVFRVSMRCLSGGH